jgi:flagellar basal body-associated protein FliL
VASERPAGNKAGKLWIIIGLLIAVFGVGMTFMTNTMNAKKIDAMTEQCEKDGGEAIVSKEKNFLSTNYSFKCKK